MTARRRRRPSGQTVRASSVCNLILWSSYVVKIQVVATVLGLVGGAPSENKQQAAAGRGCARAARWPSRASSFWKSCNLRGERELEECLLHRARERASVRAMICGARKHASMLQPCISAAPPTAAQNSGADASSHKTPLAWAGRLPPLGCPSSEQMEVS